MRRMAQKGVARAGRAPAARDRLLFRLYRDEQEPVDRDELVRRFMPLARQVAARYAGGNEPYDDLLQVASLALVRAIDRFDPGRGVAFSSYALPTIRGEIKRHYRDKTWAVRVPRDLQELAVAANAERERLSTVLGRSATTRELSERLEISEDTLLDALRAGDAHDATSLEVKRGDDESQLRLCDTLAYDERGYDLADARASLERLLATVCRRDREILRLRFEEDLTQREIGQRTGLSQMHVSRILRGVIAHLAEAAEALTTVQAPEPPQPGTVRAG
jgi:RNA polymerase sigma-B factor